MASTWRQYLWNQFRKFQREFPKEAAGSKLLSGGGHGLIIDHNDGSISKYFTAQSDIYQRERSYRLLHKETGVLGYLEEHPMDGIETPKLLDEPEPLYSKSFSARYRMTRINGNHEPYHIEKSREYYEGLYESIGSLLGKFHRATQDMPITAPVQELNFFKISHVEGAPKDVNDALTKANDHLLENPFAGVIHGDFHRNNIMVQNGIATGIIDFSFSGRSDHLHHDFHRFLKSGHDEAFLRGYREENPIDIPPHIADLTDLVYATQDLHTGFGFSTYAPENQTSQWETVNAALNNLISITGFKP